MIEEIFTCASGQQLRASLRVAGDPAPNDTLMSDERIYFFLVAERGAAPWQQQAGKQIRGFMARELADGDYDDLFEGLRERHSFPLPQDYVLGADETRSFVRWLDVGLDGEPVQIAPGRRGRASGLVLGSDRLRAARTLAGAA